jgi:hypothetical protein
VVGMVFGRTLLMLHATNIWYTGMLSFSCDLTHYSTGGGCRANGLIVPFYRW